jgi:hypothetical protein
VRSTSVSTSHASPTSIEGSIAMPGLVPAAGTSLPVTVPGLVLVLGVDCGGAPVVCGTGVVGAQEAIAEPSRRASTSLRSRAPLIA